METTKLKHPNATHGLSKHPLFPKLNKMRSRCYNSKSDDYKYYGGRGITVCDEWLNNPQSFFDWALSNGYKKGLEIDREDNNGNYEPSNCRWVTHDVNSQNTRRRVLTREDVEEIRRLYDKGIKQKYLATMFNTGQGHISNVIVKRFWK